jgi:hypothetical protein
MRKILPVILCLFINQVKGQSFTERVPENSYVVVHYSGKTITNAIPVSKLDKYDIIRNDFFKALHLDTARSLTETGIDFSSDLVQYVSYKDTVMGFVTLFTINDQAKFLRLVDANYGAELRPLKKDGYEIVYLSNNSAISWSGSNGVFVYGDFMGRKNYWSNNVYDVGASDTAVAIMPDTTATIDQVTELPPPPPPPPPAPAEVKPAPDVRSPKSKTKPKSKSTKPATGAQKRGKTKSNNVKPKAKVHQAPPKVEDEEAATEEQHEDSTSIISDDWSSEYNLKYERWEKIQDSIAKIRVRDYADEISVSQFRNTYPSVKQLAGYEKLIDNKADITMWINTNDMMQAYWAYIYSKITNPYRSVLNIPSTPENGEDQVASGTNVYFKKDKVHVEGKSITFSEKTRSRMAAIYNNSQSKSVAGFINPGNLGYMSVSINTEAAILNYYEQLKKYMSFNDFTKEYSDIVNIYIDLLEIFIDEKAIGELLPGNYLVVLHGLKSREVKYTDYEYDSNFVAKEIEKTKQELSPDFSFVIDTRRPDFINKALDVPLKYAERMKYNYQKKNDYYELSFPEGKALYSSIYFMVRDGRFVITTNKDVIEKVMHDQPFMPGKETEKRITDNTFDLHFDLSGIIRAAKTQFEDANTREIAEYLASNIKNIDGYASFKKGEMSSVMDFQLSDNFENSLIGIFEMIEKVNEMNKNAAMDGENKRN